MTDLERLVAKEEITDQLYTYARGLDRIDPELGKACFDPNADVDYGPIFKGKGPGFIDDMLNQHRGMIATHHVVTNILIKFSEDGTRAASECYLYAACRFTDEMTVIARCRDMDNWVKREGKWVTVKRIVAGDNSFMLIPAGFTDSYNYDRDNKNDPSYEMFKFVE